MNTPVGKVLGEANAGGPCRESSDRICQTQAELHEREARAWRWIENALAAYPPNELTEAAVWELLLRARRETRF